MGIGKKVRVGMMVTCRRCIGDAIETVYVLQPPAPQAGEQFDQVQIPIVCRACNGTGMQRIAALDDVGTQRHEGLTSALAGCANTKE